MNLLLSILLFAVALVASATEDSLASVINPAHHEVRSISDGGLSLPGTSLVTVNNIIVATESTISFYDTSLVSSAITPSISSTITSATVDTFPPISPGQSNVHSSIDSTTTRSIDSTTTILSTVTLIPTEDISTSEVTSLLTINSSKAALIPSIDMTTTPIISSVTSDINQSSNIPSTAQTSNIQTLPSQSLTIQPIPLQSTGVKSSGIQSSASQSSAVQYSEVQSSSTQLTTQSAAAQSSKYIGSQVSITNSLPTTNTENAPFMNSTASLVQSLSSSANIPTSTHITKSSVSGYPSIIVGIPQSNSANLPTVTPTYSNTANTPAYISSSTVSTIVGTPQSKSANLPTPPYSNSSSSIILGTSQSNSATLPAFTTAPYSNSSSTTIPIIVGTPQTIVSSNSSSTSSDSSIGIETSITSTTTVTSTTIHTGTITRTITQSSNDITSQPILGKFPATEVSDIITETFTSGSSTWTITETGPPSTITASLMLNPSFSNADNVIKNDVESGSCTCPEQVTITVTATPFIITGGTLTGGILTGAATSTTPSTAPSTSTGTADPVLINTSKESSISSSRLTTYYAPTAIQSWTTHNIPGFIGVIVPSGGMSYGSYQASMEPSVSTTCTDTPSASDSVYPSIPNSVSGSITASVSASAPTSNSAYTSNPKSTYPSNSNPASIFTAIPHSDYQTLPTQIPATFLNQSTSTKSLLGTEISGTQKTNIGTIIPAHTSSAILQPTPTAIYTGNADVNVVGGGEPIALVVGFVALILLI